MSPLGIGRLAGKTAVVTGAGGAPDLLGVGAAIAALFAREGANVALLDISAERAAHTQDVIAEAGGVSEVFQVDITNHEACIQALADCAARFGGVDILVNNAALYANPSMGEDEAGVRRLMDVNLFGTMNMTEAARPHLAKGGRGAILNIGSIVGLRGVHGPAYSASKGATAAYTRATAHLFGREGIRVNYIAPGHIVAPQSAAADAKTRNLLRNANLLGVEGDARDVAEAALFLASDAARFITAVVLPVDGGVTATTPSGMAYAILQSASED